jgi:hypothetical protein
LIVDLELLAGYAGISVAGDAFHLPLNGGHHGCESQHLLEVLEAVEASGDIAGPDQAGLHHLL